MKKYFSICLTLVLLVSVILPLVLHGATTPLEHIYYSSGGYDGGLWYSTSQSSGAEVEYQSNPYISYSTFTVENATRYLAQTFLCSSSHTVTKASLYLHGSATVGSCLLQIWSTVAGVPNVSPAPEAMVTVPRSLPVIW